jgi:biopolymer transport protein ExbD
MDIENLIQPYQLPETKPEISITPMIDVIFLMLIFFMVTTVFPENKGMVIHKPKAEHATTLSTKSKIIKLNKEGKISVNNTIVSESDLRRLLEYEISLRADLSIIIHADKQSTTAQ